MGKRNIYSYDGMEFHSIGALAAHVGMKEKTLTARLRKGMSINEACNKADLRCAYHTDNGEQKSIEQICTEQSKDSSLVRNRMKYGYSLNDALNKPKKITRQGRPTVVYGILYNSIAAAVKKLNLEEKESTIRRRLKSGMAPDNAFYFED